MRQSIIDQWTDEQQYLVDHSMADMDKNYDAAMKLLRDKERPDRHNTREALIMQWDCYFVMKLAI